MKRSEMNDHIYEEIKEFLEKRQYSNETDEKYWRRRSASILDMLLGFGMLPPKIIVQEPDNDSGCIEESSYSFMRNEWEDETK